MRRDILALVSVFSLVLSVVILVLNGNLQVVHGMAADCALEPTGENYIGVRYKALLVEDELSETGWVLSFAGNGFTVNGEYQPHFMELMIKGGWADIYDDGLCANGFPSVRETRRNFTIHFQLSDYEDGTRQDNDIAARSRDPRLLPLCFTNIDSTEPQAPDMIAAEYQVDKGGTLEGREIEVFLERGEVTRLPTNENYFIDPDSGCKPKSQADILYRQWIATLKVPSLGIDSSVDFYVNASQGDKINGANTLNFMWENYRRPAIETDKFNFIVFDMEVKTTSGEWRRVTRFLADYRTPRDELPLNGKGQMVGGYRKVNYNNQPALEASFGYGYTDYVIDGDPTNYEPTAATKAVIDLQYWEGTFDFSLFNSGDITVSQGSMGSNTIAVNLLGTSAEYVSLSCIAGLPPGTSCSFSPMSANPPFVSTLTIATLMSTPAGSYAITIMGDGGVYRTTTFTLTVNPPPMIDSVDANGNIKNTFDYALNEKVYVKGSNFLPATTFKLYVVPDGAEINPASALSDKVRTIITDGFGNIPITEVGLISTVGKYDLWADVNNNGVNDPDDVVKYIEVGKSEIIVISEFHAPIMLLTTVLFLEFLWKLKLQLYGPAEIYGADLVESEMLNNCCWAAHTNTVSPAFI